MIDGWRESHLRGPGDFLAECDRNEYWTGSQGACVLDLVLSLSGFDTLDKSLVSLDSALSFLLMNWMSIQKGCSTDLQVAQSCKGIAIILTMIEVRLKNISMS